MGLFAENKLEKNMSGDGKPSREAWPREDDDGVGVLSGRLERHVLDLRALGGRINSLLPKQWASLNL